MSSSKTIVERMSAANAFDSPATANLWLAQGIREIERLQRDLAAAHERVDTLTLELENTNANLVKAIRGAAEPPSASLCKCCSCNSRFQDHDFVTLESVQICTRCGATENAVTKEAAPPSCVHPWEHVGFSGDGRPFCGACRTNLVKDPPWQPETKEAAPPSPRLTYSQACDLLARYAIALQDRHCCGDSMQPEYMAALKKCTDAMGVQPETKDADTCSHPNMEELRKCPKCSASWWPSVEKPGFPPENDVEALRRRRDVYGETFRPADEKVATPDSRCPITKGGKHKSYDGQPGCYYCGAYLVAAVETSERKP